MLVYHREVNEVVMFETDVSVKFSYENLNAMASSGRHPHNGSDGNQPFRVKGCDSGARISLLLA